MEQCRQQTNEAQYLIQFKRKKCPTKREEGDPKINLGVEEKRHIY
jgi:hypothetical protein